MSGRRVTTRRKRDDTHVRPACFHTLLFKTSVRPSVRFFFFFNGVDSRIEPVRPGKSRTLHLCQMFFFLNNSDFLLYVFISSWRKGIFRIFTGHPTPAPMSFPYDDGFIQSLFSWKSRYANRRSDVESTFYCDKSIMEAFFRRFSETPRLDPMSVLRFLAKLA